MNRIELYVDRENRLTLDFFYDKNDDYSMSQFKGEKCYAIISRMCQKSLTNVIVNSNTNEISLFFDNCVFNINDCKIVLKKRGTSPLKEKLTKHYEEQEQKTFVQKEVKRINKHIGKEIIAGALVLSLLGGMLVIEHSRKKKNGTPEVTENTTSTTQSVEQTNNITPIEEEFTIGNTSFEKTDNENEIKLENLNNPKVDSFEESSNIEIYIPFEDRSNTEKARITKAYYGSTIESYAKMYGVDPKIMIAIATQERGIHSDVMDRGGATGLMQIQNAVWLGENITAYNYDLQRYETISIDKSKLSDVFYNIKIGCMYFQNCMNYMDGNILAAIQCYNYGFGNMDKVFKQYSFESGKNAKETLADISDCDWMNCRSAAVGNVGDKNYIENVISWIGSTINFENSTLKDQTASIIVTNSNPQKTR